jgi:serine/threonine-protein kinase
MLVGRPPQRWLEREALEEGHVTDAPPDERLQLDSLPEPMERVLVRMLAQAPDRRFASADEVIAAFDAVTSGGAQGTLPPRPAPRRGRKRGMLAGLAVAALALAAAVAAVIRSRGGDDLDPNRVAVAPFDVLEPGLATWREGLVDLLSAQLDGAGPLHAVPPSTVLRRWQGRADAVSAARLGASLGAGLVLVGRVVGAGADSARALATLFDVAAGTTVGEFDLRDQADRIDRLADSLAVQLMTGLSRARRISVWRLASLGSSSPAAIKAFLQGEQHYRDFGLDSAVAYYDRAIELDSTFALAYSRRSNAAGWSLDLGPEFTQFLLRAGELNQGLARRESLLVAADSIEGALTRFSGDSTAWRLLNRLFTTLEYAAQRYPSDPQVWFELGEARYHYGPNLAVTDQAAYEAFQRAVALDSAFAPAYRHQIELALLLGDREAAQRIAADYVNRSDPSAHRDAAAVSAALLDPGRADEPSTQAALEALPREAFFQTYYDLKWWIDPAETSKRVARAWYSADSSSLSRQSLALALAYRGHLAEAYDLIGGNEPALFAVLARFGAIPRDTANAQFAAWLGERNVAGIQSGHRWWAATGDTAALAGAVAYWDSLETAFPYEQTYRVRDIMRSVRAYLALARGDTVGAVSLFATVPAWPNRFFNYYERLTRAQLLSRTGRDREAAELLDNMPFLREFSPTADAIVTELERGRVHERLGNREIALRAYGTVVDAWRDADPVLQPLVAEAREAIARLAAEPRR